jgi:hypothetical protein
MSWRPRRFPAALSRGADAASRFIWAASELLTRSFAARLLAVLFTVVFFVNGALGVDFGSHWDEWYHGQVVASCIQRMSLLPDGLSYGGPYFTLGFPVVIVHQWKNIVAILKDMRTQPARLDPLAFPSVARFKAEATALLNTAAYLVEVRTVFLAVSTFGVLWMFFATLRCLPKRRGAALAAAAFMAFSWELGYHARWVAIDAPLMQFCALELFLFCGAWRAPSDGPTVRWYCGAAAAAGAVFACKLTGLFAFLPIMWLPLLSRSGWSLGRRLKLLALGTAIFVLVSFALSPAFYLDPLHLINVFRSGSADYNGTTNTYPHYVGVAEHALRMLLWYFWAVPSPYLTVAIAFSVIAFIGLGIMLRRETRMTLSWLSFMVAFIGVFTHNHLLIVRQYLMCVPFLALCFARGAAAVWDFLRVRDRRLAAAFVAMVVLGFALNARFESKNAWRVTHDSAAAIDADAAHDLLAHRGPVRMSRPVLDRLKPLLGPAYVCHPSDLKDKTIPHFLAFQIEHEWMSNRVNEFRHVYGAGEANLNYYSFWLGRMHAVRLVDVSMSVMKALGREMSVDMDCFPSGTAAATALSSPGGHHG